MRAVESWAVRKNVDEAEGPSATPAEVANAKRATIVVKIPRAHRDWPPLDDARPLALRDGRGM